LARVLSVIAFANYPDFSHGPAFMLWIISGLEAEKKVSCTKPARQETAASIDFSSDPE
jgi:hypothetical protein